MYVWVTIGRFPLFIARIPELRISVCIDFLFYQPIRWRIPKEPRITTFSYSCPTPKGLGTQRKELPPTEVNLSWKGHLSATSSLRTGLRSSITRGFTIGKTLGQTFRSGANRYAEVLADEGELVPVVTSSSFSPRPCGNGKSASRDKLLGRSLNEFLRTSPPLGARRCCFWAAVRILSALLATRLIVFSCRWTRDKTQYTRVVRGVKGTNSNR